MNRSVVAASVSMQGLQQRLDVLSNNVANVDTVGYKKNQVSFQDVLTSVQNQSKDFSLPGRMTPLGYNMGWGARLTGMSLDMTQGSFKQTDNPLDVAIQGQGLIEIGINTIDDAGNEIVKPVWTRNGSFNISIDKDGNAVLATKDGHAVRNTDDQSIYVPNNHRLVISETGYVTAYDDTDPGAAPVDLGQIKLVHVTRPQLLTELGDGLYDVAVPAGQDPTTWITDNVLQDSVALVDDHPNKITLKQGFLEQSNVNIADEMTDLIMVQRAFQLSSRALSNADTMMGLANNLRG
ncbi:flagellar hook-basal body protein [Paenibacillus albiflavus]|uniref:Flagellar hook-basal body protein n=1 Tax=Paenibacillus albiflavus TaxID=2545760 RepID=A0A4R4EAC6_9BACL|nr:flagellar hook-basal body protein [Paenibacillus albiflavus]TCZ76814.1 flagellar hook-basal body protein [Paenibacillus albiflavus]